MALLLQPDLLQPLNVIFVADESEAVTRSHQLIPCFNRVDNRMHLTVGIEVVD